MTAYPHLFSGVADPEHDDQESDRLSADLPHLGLRPVERPLYRAGDSLLRGARERGRRADHHRRDPRPREFADGAAPDAAAVGRPQHRATLEDRGRGARSRLQACDPALALACAASRSTSRRRSSTSTRPGTRCRRARCRSGSSPAPRRRRSCPRTRSRRSSTRMRPPRARGRRRVRRGRVPSQPRLPAVAVPLAPLQQAHRRVGRLVREPASLPTRGAPPDAAGDGRRPVPRLPDQLDVVLAGRPRARGHREDRPGHRGGRRDRLRERLRRRPPRVHPHADGVRARLGEGLRARDPRGFLEAGPARRPDHDAGRRRVAARRRRR